jgi:serine/threonine protein kinase
MENKKETSQAIPIITEAGYLYQYPIRYDGYVEGLWGMKRQTGTALMTIPLSEKIMNIESGSILSNGTLLYDLDAQVGRGSYGQVWLIKNFRFLYKNEENKEIVVPILGTWVRKRIPKELSPDLSNINEIECFKKIHGEHSAQYSNGEDKNGEDKVDYNDLFFPYYGKEQKESLNSIAVNYIFYKFFRAIKAMHDEKVNHRDLKPGNFIILKTLNDLFECKIIDFGLAGFQEQDDGDSIYGNKQFASIQQL